MALINYQVQYTLLPGSYGVLIQYRNANTAIWTTPSVPDNPTMNPTYPLELEEGNTYYVKVTTQGPGCPPQSTIVTVIVPATDKCCPEGYTLAPDESYCYKVEEMAPTILISDICLAPSILEDNYSAYGTRIYDPGFSVNLQTYTLDSEITTAGYWKDDTVVGAPHGPMNREGVWTDADCNGTKDALTAGSILQLSYLIDAPVDKIVYVGIAGDNTFRMDLQNTDGDNVILNVGTLGGGAGNVDGIAVNNFRWWHIVPIQLRSGPNQINFQAIGDGSVNDSFAAVIYDNTVGELLGATQDADLDILFQTSAFRGGHVDIASCPAGWQLDTSGGQGNYVCRRTLVDDWEECTPP
jgi:hypothetical protein